MVRPDDWGACPNKQSRDRDNSVMVEITQNWSLPGELSKGRHVSKIMGTSYFRESIQTVGMGKLGRTTQSGIVWKWWSVWVRGRGECCGLNCLS